MLDLCVFVCLFVVVLVLHEFTTPRGSGPR